MKVYVLIFSTCYFSVLASGDISGMWNNVNSAAKDFGNTVHKGINAVGTGISKIPDTVNNAVKDFGNTVDNRVNAVDIEISKFQGTVYSAVDAAGNTVNIAAKDFGNTVNNGVNAVGNGISKVPRLVNGVVCSDVLTGVLINLLIACNPHAFITDTLNTEDTVMMESCKYIEVASFAFPVLANLATAPKQVVCSVWAGKRLELYSHLKGIEVYQLHPLPILSNTISIDNNKLFYELAKMNDQYCNDDCNVKDYEFIDPPSSFSSDDNGRFKRSVSSNAFKEVAESISKQYVVKSILIIVRKNGVQKSITYRGLKGTVCVRAKSEFTAGLLNIHRKKTLGFRQKVDSLIDLFTKYKIIPNTLTTKYFKYPPTLTDFMKIAWENWYRELL